MEKPLISVIMPAYNCGKYIDRSIKSILNQSFHRFELIIIDDHSSDSTYKISRKYSKIDPRIKLFRNVKTMQVAYSLQKGLHESKCGLVARMDADDYSYPQRLEKQYRVLMKNPKVAIVGADMEIVNEEGKKIFVRKYPKSDSELKAMLFRYSPFAHPVVMFRKKAVMEFGGYDLSMVPCEDIDLWFKLGSKYRFASIGQILLVYTFRHGSNSSKKLRSLELLGLKIKLNAIKKYDYRPSFFDILYNILEYASLFVMPGNFRIKLYNTLRSRNMI
ncbi:glycosyltransferase [Patescibacteria group bacterium]